MGSVTSSTWGRCKCQVVLFAEQDTLAAERVAGRQRVAQLFVGDVLVQKVLGQSLDRGQPRVVGGQCGVVVLQLPQPPPFAPRRPRLLRNRDSSSALNGRSSLGTIHGGVRWKTVNVVGDVGDFGNDLHAAGTRADDRHPLAGQVDGGVPPRGVHQRRRRSRSTPSMSGYRAAPNNPTALTTTSATTASPSSSSTSQCRASAFHRSCLHGRAEHQVTAEVEVVGDRLEVGEDLGLIGVGATPCPVRRERERVQVALDVACRARVDVLPPGAADAVGAFDDRQVVDALAPQCDRGGEAAEARPDDHHAR